MIFSAALRTLFVLLLLGLSCAAQSTQVVVVSGFSFVPSNFTIQAGDTVMWTNLAAGNHNVVEVDCPATNISVWNLGFRSGTPAQFDTFSLTFDSAGDYCYICEPHVGFGMKASFTVLPAPPSAWEDLGCALDGVNGPPLLKGSGPLTGGSNNALDLSGANGSAICVLFVSLAEHNTPFKGGIIKSVPELLSIGLNTSPAGSVPLPFVFPNGIPAGFELFFQYAISDDAAVAKVALSNAVKGTAQ